MAHYAFYTGDLATGGPLVRADLVSASWSIPFTGPGSLDGEHPLRSGEWPTARPETTVGKRFLAVAYIGDDGSETFLEAGPIWRSSYTKSSGVLKVSAAGMLTYFDHRKLVPIVAANTEVETLRFTGSLAKIARDVIALTLAHTGGRVPVTLPDDLPGGQHERNYPGYELGWVGERLKQLSEVVGGPEIQLVPRRRVDAPDHLEWVAEIGGPDSDGMLTQDGDPHVLDCRPVRSGLRELTVEADGSRLADRVWSAGQGEGEGRPIEYAEASDLRDSGWPLLEAEVTTTDSVSERSTLAGHAQERLLGSSRAIEVTTVEWERDGAPLVRDMRPGDMARLVIADDPYLPDGTTDHRIVVMSGSSGADRGFVKLTMAERLEG